MEQTWLGQIFTMATGLRCTVDACEYNTDSQVPNDTDLPTKVQLLQIHAGSVHNSGGGQVRTPGSKAKMDTPKIQLGVDQQAWDQFMTRWNIYKTTMGIDGGTASSWLFNCLDRDLGDAVLKANPGTEPQNMS